MRLIFFLFQKLKKIQKVETRKFETSINQKFKNSKIHKIKISKFLGIFEFF